jgi:hypothetical protein
MYYLPRFVNYFRPFLVFSPFGVSATTYKAVSIPGGR